MSDIVELRSTLLSALAESLLIPSCNKESTIQTQWTVDQVESLLSDVLQITVEHLESNNTSPDTPDVRKALTEHLSLQAVMTDAKDDRDGDTALADSIHTILNQRDDPIVSINGKLLRRIEVEYLKKALALKDKNNTSNTIQ